MNRRDDALRAILVGAFFAGIGALAIWGYFPEVPDRDVTIIFITWWVVLSILFYRMMRWEDSG